MNRLLTELHREDYAVAKMDWHASAERQTLLGVIAERTSKSNQQKKGGSFEPNEPPRSAPASGPLGQGLFFLPIAIDVTIECKNLMT